MTGTTGPVAANDVGRLRRARGWSQEALAQRIPVDPSTVSRWERGLQTPDRATQERLAAMLEVRVEQLGFPTEQPALAWDVQSEHTDALALVSQEGPVHRRGFGLMLGALAGNALLEHFLAEPWKLARALSSRSVDKLSLESFEQTATGLEHQYWRGGLPIGGQQAMLAPILTQLQAMRDLLGEPQTLAARRRLVATSAQLAGLAGWAAFDLHDDRRTADAYFQAAMRGAEEVGDQTLGLQVLGRRLRSLLNTSVGTVARLNAAKEVVAFVDALPRTVGLASARTQSYFASLAAEAHARLGDAVACEQALSRAQEQMGRAETGRPFEFFDSPRLAMNIGLCYVELADPRLARAALADALALQSDEAPINGVITGLYAALSYLHAGDIDAAVAAGQQFVDLPVGYRISRVRRTMSSLVESLRPYRDHGPARELGVALAKA